ncbi:MAG: flagellar motor protein MotA [Pseudomonadota bacterium]
MAQSLERSARFRKPGDKILNMLLFLTLVGAGSWYLSPWGPNANDLLISSFMANPPLNGLIIAVLFFGVIFNLRQAGIVAPAVRWVDAFRESVDPGRTRLPRPPSIIRAMAQLLLEADRQGGARLAPASTRAILDSIGTRMDEGRDTGRYIRDLLVFLGLLGTFWGLLQTVNAVADTISGLADTGGTAEDAVTQLITNLREPLSGMGTAFSSSLFGLGGSLIVSFLDLQAGEAQNRFYSDLEDWLSGLTATGAGASGPNATYAGDDAPLSAAPAVSGDVSGLAQQIAALNANLEAQQKAIAKLAAGGSRRGAAQLGDDALLAPLQAIEDGVKRLHDAQDASSQKLATEMTEEIRALNRTLVRIGEGR